MKKLLALLVLAALAGGGAFAYMMMRPAHRACAHYADLCSKPEEAASDQKKCEDSFAELRKTAGEQSVERPARCVLESTTCPAAIGCVVGGIGGGLIKAGASEFLKGLGKALDDK